MTFRILGPHERGRFAPEAWGQLLALSRTGTLTSSELEQIIERALVQIDGRIALDALSIEKRGQLLFILVNARPMAELQIDQRVADGRIYVASGLTKADIESFKKCWRLIGEKKKR